MNTPAIRETHQMGRAAVLVICTATATAGALRLAGVDVSGIVARTPGGQALDYAWGGALVLAAVLVWIARFTPDPDISANVEMGGLLIHCLGFIAYVYAVLVVAQPVVSAYFVLTVIVGDIVNCCGRARLLHQRVGWGRGSLR